MLLNTEHLLELAMEISVDSLGSSQTFLLPQPKMLAANLFCNLSDTIVDYLLFLWAQFDNILPP